MPVPPPEEEDREEGSGGAAEPVFLVLLAARMAVIVPTGCGRWILRVVERKKKKNVPNPHRMPPRTMPTHQLRHGSDADEQLVPVPDVEARVVDSEGLDEGPE